MLNKAADGGQGRVVCLNAGRTFDCVCSEHQRHFMPTAAENMNVV